MLLVRKGRPGKCGVQKEGKEGRRTVAAYDFQKEVLRVLIKELNLDSLAGKAGKEADYREAAGLGEETERRVGLEGGV